MIRATPAFHGDLPFPLLWRLPTNQPIVPPNTPMTHTYICPTPAAPTRILTPLVPHTQNTSTTTAMISAKTVLFVLLAMLVAATATLRGERQGLLSTATTPGETCTEWYKLSGGLQWACLKGSADPGELKKKECSKFPDKKCTQKNCCGEGGEVGYKPTGMDPQGLLTAAPTNDFCKGLEIGWTESKKNKERLRSEQTSDLSKKWISCCGQVDRKHGPSCDKCHEVVWHEEELEIPGHKKNTDLTKCCEKVKKEAAISHFCTA